MDKYLLEINDDPSALLAELAVLDAANERAFLEMSDPIDWAALEACASVDLPSASLQPPKKSSPTTTSPPVERSGLKARGGRTTSVSARLPNDLLDDLREAARKAGLPYQRLMVRLLRQQLSLLALDAPNADKL